MKRSRKLCSVLFWFWDILFNDIAYPKVNATRYYCYPCFFYTFQDFSTRKSSWTLDFESSQEYLIY